MGLSALACLAVASSLLSACAASPATPADLGRPGPYPVGVTTLDLGSAGTFGERMATVFYPADRSRLAGHRAFSYAEADALPTALRAFVPSRYDVVTTLPARVSPPASRSGPFPVVLFSHGFGASRLYYSHLLVGIATWGYVVVSADYLERGLVAQVGSSKVTDTPQQDLTVMFSSLSSVEEVAADPQSVLSGAVDAHRVAAMGHSAGGQTAFDALRDPRVTTAVGWAPVGPSGPAAHKPVVIIGGQQDIALTPATLAGEYRRFPGPTSLVEIGGAGHDTFTDVCPTIRGGGGLVGFAISSHFISADLAKLAVNGCEKHNLSPTRFWAVVQYYSVAALRSAFHQGRAGALAPPADGQFPGVSVSYRQH